MVPLCWLFLGNIKNSKVPELLRHKPSLPESKGGTAAMLQSPNKTIYNVEAWFPKKTQRERDT